MFCRNCGQQLPEGAKFCTQCGTAVEGDIPRAGQWDGGNYDVNGGSRPPGSKKGLIVLAVVLAVLLITIPAGVVIYLTAGLNNQKNRLASVIESADIPEYTERERTITREWEKLDVTDVSEKKELLRELEQVEEETAEFSLNAEEVQELQSKKETFDLRGSQNGAYDIFTENLDKCVKAVKDRQAGELFTLLEDTRECLEELLEANDAYIEERIEKYENADLAEAGKKEKAACQKQMDRLRELAGGEDVDYQAIAQAFGKMDKTIYPYIEPENLLDISVQQVDVTDFPKVKLYVRAQDPVSGEVPEELDGNMFYIRKEDANAKYVKQKVTNVSQLDETEVLKVDMVADVSGSMSGSPIQEAKESMCNFVRSVQFSAGDMVELTSFSTGVRLEQEFCSDENLLLNKINSLDTGSSTSLYDALYTAVERTASQSGARCVMGFTDGGDNHSSCTREDVVAAAQRYHVPVFIIGIGSSDYSDVSYIAQQTGGVYYNIHDVYSMGSIYDEIYRMEKELFLVEFKDNTGAKVSDVSNVEAGYRSVEYGGQCRYSYTPNVLLNVKGASFYKDGPEAVVERYLRGFPNAVNNSDFSYISDCLKPGSAIYQEQQKYVLRSITEQLDSFEIVSVDYSDGSNCVAKTRETYFVQVSGEPLQLMTQECQYALEESGGQWKMTAFVGKVNVLSRINQ